MPTRILVVEDSPTQAEQLRHILEAANYRATVVASGEEALAALEAHPFDVVMSDIVMPGAVDGYELCRRIKAGPHARTPVVLLTTLSDPADIIRGLECGADNFFTKPYDPTQLLERLKALLATRKARTKERVKFGVKVLFMGRECTITSEREQILDLLVSTFEDAVRQNHDLRQREQELNAAKERLAQYAGTLQEQLQSILDNSSAVICVKDLQGRYLLINRQYESLFQVSPQSVAGKTEYDLFPKDVADVFRANDNKVLESLRPLQFDEVAPHPDGLHTYLSVKFPLYDASGAAYAVCAISTDVTDRKRAEEALRNSEERHRLLFDRNPQPLWVFDLETLRFLAVNEAAVGHYGYSRDEFLAMRIDDIRPPDEVPKFQEFLAQNSGGLQSAGAWRHRKKDGSLIDVEITSHDLHFGGRDARLVLVTDVTLRKRLEQQFLQAQKMEAVGRLAGGIAHDFNNLLTAILGTADLMLEGFGPTDPRHADVLEIKEAATRAAGLTRQLLAFSRKQVMASRVLDINDVVANIESLLRRLIGEDITLRTALAAGLGAVKADPGQLEQVILNLAVNARDAMPQGGKLTIETANIELDEDYVREHPPTRPGRYVLLAVSDTGTGMDANTKSHVFEPFFTTKEQGKGTGLGLATVYGIVKQSGGYVWVYSEPGRGTTFKVYLPRVDEAPEPAPPAPPPTSLRGVETVLVVEDEERVQRLTCKMLRARGYQVLEAARGDEALRLLERHDGPVHLLVSDVVMPGMSGRELATRCTTLRPEIKVLFLSGYTDEAIVHHGVLDPGVAFLQKPFSPDMLARKVREVLDTPTTGGSD